MKRILVLALCLMLLCPAALAEICVANYYSGHEPWGEFGLLLKDDGTPLTPPNTYRSIYQLTPEGTPEGERVYSAMACDLGIEYDRETAEEYLYGDNLTRVGLMDAEGNMLTGFDYYFLQYSNGYILFTEPGNGFRLGAMDLKGNVVMPAEYAHLQPLPGGRWLAEPISDAEPLPENQGEEDYYNYSYGLWLIEADGAARELGLRTTDHYFDTNPEGISVVWSVAEYGDKPVFVDADGEVMFDRGFESADNFEGDYAVVRTEDGCGIIDKRGDFAVAPEFSYIYHDDSGVFIANAEGRATVFDGADCATLLDMDFPGAEDVDIRAVGEGLYYIAADGQRMICGQNGETLVEFPEDATIQTYNQPSRTVGRLIREDGEWPDEWASLIDLEGNPVGEAHRSLNPGAWRGDEARYISIDYETFVDPQGETQVNWSSYRYGLIDQDGNVLLDTKYDDLQALSFDRYWAELGELRGMIDETGKWYFTISDYEELMD